ncbi:MAG: AMP-binding protein [Propionibacteriaceae bacterium]|nr:AMP-binding protein [Propionibacteriaceae bacterium]
MVPPSDRPWLSKYAKGVPAEIAQPAQPVYGVLEQAAELYPNRAAIEFMGRRTSYLELLDQVSRAAQMLHSHGVGKGSIVAIALPNCPQHVVAFYAAMRLGAIVAEHNPTYTLVQLAHQLADCGAEYLIAWDKTLRDTPEVTARLKAVFSVDMTAALPASKRFALRLPLPKTRALRDDMTVVGAFAVPAAATLFSWEIATKNAAPLDRSVPGPDLDDIALLQYTGGTTGVPKGAIITHSNLVSNAVQSVAWVVGIRPGDETFYAALPFFHAFGLNLCLMIPPLVGGTVVIFPKFSVDMVLAAHKHTPATLFAGVPPMFDRLERAASERGESLRGIRHSICGAMAVEPAVAERWEAATGGILVAGYGLTEASPIVGGNPTSADRRHDCIGLPYPSTEARIVDPEDIDRDLPYGEPGELLVRGPQVFAGYWNSPEETAAVLTPDGWLRTGDLVVMEPDGFMRLVDRIKEVIVTGGHNVYPSQIEKELLLMPESLDVTVVGVPGGDLGEWVAAAVVLAPGAKLELEQVAEWCCQRLARYAIPRELFVVQDLPRSLIGKALRRLVRKQIIDDAAIQQLPNPIPETASIPTAQ